MRQLMLLTALWVLTVPASQAEIKTEDIEYKSGDTIMKGYIAYDDSITAKRPGVLVVHEWCGHDAYARRRTRMNTGRRTNSPNTFAGAVAGVTKQPHKTGDGRHIQYLAATALHHARRHSLHHVRRAPPGPSRWPGLCPLSRR